MPQTHYLGNTSNSPAPVGLSEQTILESLLTDLKHSTSRIQGELCEIEQSLHRLHSSDVSQCCEHSPIKEPITFVDSLQKQCVETVLIETRIREISLRLKKLI